MKLIIYAAKYLIGNKDPATLLMLRFGAAISILALAPLAVLSQEHVHAPRADGHTTPLMIYKASGAPNACAPLAVISHGAGGSEFGYRYLANAMSALGYTTVVMGHSESGMRALESEMLSHGLRPGVQALVADRAAEEARLFDVEAALKWSDSQCKAPFRVLLGHSMGAITVMLEAGARNSIGISSPPAGQRRFDAYVALSPEGPGIVFPDRAWSGIHQPLLMLTGTNDQSLKGGPPARQIPWQELPGDNPEKCQWLGVIGGATHMNFAGRGMGADHTDPIVTRTIASFLAGVRRGGCQLPDGTQAAATPNLNLRQK